MLSTAASHTCGIIGTVNNFNGLCLVIGSLLLTTDGRLGGTVPRTTPLTR